MVESSSGHPTFPGDRDDRPLLVHPRFHLLHQHLWMGTFCGGEQDENK